MREEAGGVRVTDALLASMGLSTGAPKGPDAGRMEVLKARGSDAPALGAEVEEDAAAAVCALAADADADAAAAAAAALELDAAAAALEADAALEDDPPPIPFHSFETSLINSLKKFMDEDPEPEEEEELEAVAEDATVLDTDADAALLTPGSCGGGSDEMNGLTDEVERGRREMGRADDEDCAGGGGRNAPGLNCAGEEERDTEAEARPDGGIHWPGSGVSLRGGAVAAATAAAVALSSEGAPDADTAEAMGAALRKELESECAAFVKSDSMDDEGCSDSDVPRDG